MAKKACSGDRGARATRARHGVDGAGGVPVLTAHVREEVLQRGARRERPRGLLESLDERGFSSTRP